jgi:hypothetical protein
MDPQAPPHLIRPSIGDVVALLTLQIGVSALAFAGARFVAERAEAVGPFAAVLLGSLAFGLLKRKRATPSFQKRLTFWGTVVWGSAAGAMLLLIKYVYAPDTQLPGPLLLVGWAALLLCYSGLTLFGLWLGLRRRTDVAATGPGTIPP